MTKRTVVIGSVFEIDSVFVNGVEDIERLSEVEISNRHHKVREKLAYVCVGALAFALGLAAIIGWNDGSFDEVTAVWSAGAAPLGYILRGYFGKG